MGSKHFTTSLIITDSNIGVFASNKKDTNKNSQAYVQLEKGVIDFGYIKEPVKFLHAVKQTFKQLGFKPKNLNWIIQDQNILIREIVVDKDELNGQDLVTYLRSQINVTLFFPFKEAAFSYKIRHEDEKKIVLSTFIADHNLIEDYLDIFDRLGVKETSFSIISSSINALYNDRSSNPLDNAMVATIYDNNITINIIEDKLTIFGMNDETNLCGSNACSKVEDYIYRIANYYQFNLRQGKRKIENLVLIDMSDSGEKEKRLKQFKKENLLDYNTIYLSASDLNQKLVNTPHVVDISYITSVAREKEGFNNLAFHIQRPNLSIKYMNYFLMVSISIIAFISMISIPFLQNRNLINQQESINNSLILQQELLEESIDNNNSFNNYEENYNEIFVYLGNVTTKDSCYLELLLNLISEDMNLVSYKYFSEDKRIEVVINANSELELYEYVLSVYEEYGILDGADNTGKWITEYPTSSFIGTNTMRVVIYYA